MGRLIPAFAQFFDNAGDPLINGWLGFFEPNTNNTQKDTYSDSDNQIPNSNPVALDAAGRCPNVFGIGDYRVISYTQNIEDESDVGDQVQMFDPVTADGGTSGGGSGGGFDVWSATETYDLGAIVSYNTKYYRSLIGTNFNLNPAVETSSWEEIEFLPVWNNNVTYEIYDIVHYQGNLYVSLASLNSGNQPDENPDEWRRFATDYFATSVKTANYEVLPSERDYLFLLGSGATADAQFDLPVVGAAHDLFRVGICNLSDYELTINALGGLNIWTDTSGDIVLSKGAQIDLIYSYAVNGWLVLNNVAPILGGQTLGTATNPLTAIYSGLLHEVTIPDAENVFFGTAQDAYIQYDGANLYIGVVAAEAVYFTTDSTTRWLITSAGHLFPVSADTYDVGGVTNRLRHIYQGDTGLHYFGSDQDGSIRHDGTDFLFSNLTGSIYLTNVAAGSIIFSTDDTVRWGLNASGHIIPNLDVTYDIGSDTYTIRNIYVSNVPDADNKVANKLYVDTAISNLLPVMVNNSNGNPNMSDTIFEVSAPVPAGAWESIGPTGAGADNTWTALNSVPVGCKWIRVRVNMSYFSVLATATECYLRLYARKTGSTQGIGDDNILGDLVSWVPSGGDVNSARENLNVEHTIPIDSSRRFDVYWTYNQIGGVLQPVQLLLVGCGY